MRVFLQAFVLASLSILVLANISAAQETPSYEERAIDFSSSGLQERLDPVLQRPDGISLRQEDGFVHTYSDTLDVPWSQSSPMLAVGNVWKANRNAPDEITLKIRGSIDGDEWTEWYDAGFDPHIPPEDGVHGGQLIFFDKDTQYIEYKVTTSENQQGGEELVLKQIDFSFISPGATPESDLQEMQQARDRNLQQKSISQTTGSLLEPEYVDRETWGETLGLSNTNSSRVTMEVSHLVVHHTATQHPDEDWAAAVRSFYTFHTETNNWVDIGYQWLVGGDGTMFQGRAFHSEEEQDVIGAHIGGQNTGALGFGVIGNFDVGDSFPTDDALKGLYNLLGWRADLSDIEVLDSSVKVGMNTETEHIGGHRDYGATACPGQNLYDELEMVRQETAEFMDLTVDYHIPLADNEEGFESLADAFEFFNTAERETPAQLILHEDLVENASDLTLSVNYLDEDTEITILPAEEADVTIHITGSDESGLVFDDTRYVSIIGNTDSGAITLTGDPDLDNLIHLTNGASHINLEGLTFSPDEADHRFSGIAITDAGSSAELNISDNQFGDPETGLSTGITVDDVAGSLHLGTNEFFYIDHGITISNTEDLEITDQKFIGIAGTHDDENSAAIGIFKSNDIFVHRNDISVSVTEISSSGIELSASNSTNIYNNLIRVYSDSEVTDPAPVYGIHNSGNTLSETRFFYNTIFVESSEHFGATTAFNIADTIEDNAPDIRLRNNIFINRSEADEALAISIPDINYPYITPENDNDSDSQIDFNNYYTHHAVWGMWGDETTGDIQQWQEWTGQDGASSSTDVAFNSEEELKLIEPSVGDIQLSGVPIDQITSDYYGNERNWNIPYMGAFEPDFPLSIVESADFYVGKEGTGPEGTNPDFATLEETFAILNELEVTQAKTIYISSDVNDNTGKLVLDNATFSENNPLTIKPAYDEEIVLALHSGIEIRNTSHVTLDGAFDEESKNLTFSASGDETQAAISIIGSSSDITIENMMINHHAGSVLGDGSSILITADEEESEAPSNINVYNNQIGSDDAHFDDGVLIEATSDLTASEIVIEHNEITAGHRGVASKNGQAITAQQNNITISGRTRAPAYYAGIFLDRTEDSELLSNHILITGSNSPRPQPVAGINIGSNQGNHNIFNNMIAFPGDYQTRGSIYNRAYGISFHDEGDGEIYNFYHNSINLEDMPEIHEDNLIAVIGWEGDVENNSAEISFTNNIFRNRSTFDNAVLIDWPVNIENLTERYNLLSARRHNVAIAKLKDDELLSTFPEWRSETGNGEYSRIDQVYFESDRDLSLADASIGQSSLSGTPLSEVTEDIFGNSRSTEYPYKGAHEQEEELTDINEDPLADLPDSYQLNQNYPNPFNPSTTISYQLPEAAHVELTVYSIDGRRVQTLVSQQQEAGRHRIEFDASSLSSGTYIYRLQAGEFSKTKTMMFLK